jgi:hypothetical protein
MRIPANLPSLSQTGRGTAIRVVEEHLSVAFAATSPQLCCREEKI